MQCWLTHVASSGSLSWEQFQKIADGLPSTLAKDGGMLLDYRAADYTDRRLLEQCRNVINLELDELKRQRGEGFKTKSPQAVEVDARSMALVARQRRGRAQSGRFWPGAWILTPDKRLAPAYRRIDDADEFPLTLSGPQLAVLLSTFVPAASKQGLAESAAELLSHETLIQVASRYPPDVATQIARTLSKAGRKHDIDVRLAQQLTFEELVDFDGRSGADADKKAAAALLAARVQRRERIASLELEKARAGRESAEEQSRRAQEQAVELERAVVVERQQAARQFEEAEVRLRTGAAQDSRS